MAEQPKITLVWLEKSRAQRIVWLLEEIGFDYEVKAYKRQKNLAPPELKDYHPLGKAPVITVDGQTLAESGFICEYMIDKYAPTLKPAEGTPEYLQYKYLMHYTEGSLMPFMVMTLVMNTVKNSPLPFFIKPIASRIADGVLNSYVTPNAIANIDYIEGLLKDQPFFAGQEVTGADIMLSFPLESASGRLGSWFTKEKYPNIYAWLDRIKERPAYKRATDKISKIEANL